MAGLPSYENESRSTYLSSYPAELGLQSCLSVHNPRSSWCGRNVDSTLCKLESAVPVVPPTSGGYFQQVLLASAASADGRLCFPLASLLGKKDVKALPWWNARKLRQVVSLSLYLFFISSRSTPYGIKINLKEMSAIFVEICSSLDILLSYVSKLIGLRRAACKL
ncbi:hypothetical protein AVEN_4515-1 [Araneus ventricosus]|uniref:Uncharacterized protein n=1 Tax=Araneus ventricosus TaxID=182803 RepID=A0A4Y2BN11_ARAVE|nr:hypothetical protein AVEN_4515-1 [Araneus ventricosus]